MWCEQCGCKRTEKKGKTIKFCPHWQSIKTSCRANVASLTKAAPVSFGSDEDELPRRLEVVNILVMAKGGTSER